MTLMQRVAGILPARTEAVPASRLLQVEGETPSSHADGTSATLKGMTLCFVGFFQVST